jgi:hypothetical protein
VPVFWFAPEVVDPSLVPAEGPLAGEPQGEGVIDGVALALGREFPSEGTETVLRVRTRVAIPSGADAPRTARLFFVDGKQGSGRWTENTVSFQGYSVRPRFEECAFAVEALAAVFKRGDADGNGSLGMGDVIFVLRYLFLGGGDLPCADAADANDDGAVGLGDAVYLLNYQFTGGPDPAAPGPHSCGVDPTPTSAPGGATCDYPAAACEG